jgi:uncharacterized protein (UPF0332 family)
VLTERLSVAKKYLDDARYLLAAQRLASAVSRAYYAAYQAMWAALGDPPKDGQWKHIGIISHFVRGYWCEPTYPQTGPGLLEHLRFSLHRLYQFRIDADYDLTQINANSAEECIKTTERTIAEIDQRGQGETPVNIQEQREKSLAEAVAILVEEIHQSFPAASTRPIPPYEDEDFTLEVRIPPEMDREEVMNECIRHALKIEDQFGFAILTRVRSD